MKLLDNTKTSFLDLLVIFIFIVFAGNASKFVRGLGEYDQLGNVVAVLIAVLFAVKRKVMIQTPMFFAMVGVFTAYAVINSFFFLHFSLTFFLRWYSLLFITYVIIQYYGSRLFVYYETVVFYMSILAVAIWITYLFAPELIRTLLTTFRFSESYSENFDTVNAIFYTLNDREFGSFKDIYYIDRNAGFAWEPGAFSCLVCFGIACNALRTNLQLKKNYPLLVFIVALLSSQSTTGFFIFITMLLVWLFVNRKWKYGFVGLPIAAYLYSLPLVKGKISQEYSAGVINLAEMNGETLNRFQSFQITMIDFMHYPILGYGGGGQSYLSSIGFEGQLSSGLGSLMSQFGIIMTILVIVLIFRSGNYYCKIFNNKNGYLIVVCIIGLMISYHIWNQPILMAMWMGGALLSK